MAGWSLSCKPRSSGAGRAQHPLPDPLCPSAPSCRREEHSHSAARPRTAELLVWIDGQSHPAQRNPTGCLLRHRPSGPSSTAMASGGHWGFRVVTSAWLSGSPAGSGTAFLGFRLRCDAAIPVLQGNRIKASGCCFLPFFGRSRLQQSAIEDGRTFMWGFLFFRSSKKSSNQTGSCGGILKKKSPTLKASHAKETSKLCCVNCSGTQSYDKMA